MTYKFTPEQEAWLRDLETTEALQCNGQLEKELEGGPGYCCLGRAAVVLGIAYIKHSARLSEEGRHKLRLKGTMGTFSRSTIQNGHECHDLADLNDVAELSFKQIASFIRLNPENVFFPPEEGTE